MPRTDFDFAADLQAAGASPEVSQAIVRVINEKFEAQLATKVDLANLRTELVETREVLRGEIAAVRAELKAEVAQVRSEMATKEELAALELRLTDKIASIYTKTIIWLIGTALTSIGLVAAIGQLLK